MRILKNKEYYYLASDLFFYDSVLDCYSEGVDCGDEAGEWISRHLNKSGVRLVRFTESHAKRTLGQREEILRDWGVEPPDQNPKVHFNLTHPVFRQLIFWLFTTSNSVRSGRSGSGLPLFVIRDVNYFMTYPY